MNVNQNMETHNEIETVTETEGQESFLKKNVKYFLPLSIVFAAITVSGTMLYIAKTDTDSVAITKAAEQPEVAPLVDSEEVVPSAGITLPITWGDLGTKLIETAVIDKDEFETLYAQRGGLTEGDKALLYRTDNGNVVLTPENSGVILNLLWAFGIGNKNNILETGPIQDPRYGGAERFASTGGWTLAKGDPMGHFSKHTFVTLTPEQQALVEKIAPTIFRPCCDNSTLFPDCNHGMAMLGLLELMASQGVSEEEMYKVALQVNSYWFPDNYLTIATFLKSKGIEWATVNPKEILGANFSSASANKQIAAQITTQPQGGGSGCGA